MSVYGFAYLHGAGRYKLTYSIRPPFDGTVGQVNQARRQGPVIAAFIISNNTVPIFHQSFACAY